MSVRKQNMRVCIALVVYYSRIVFRKKSLLKRNLIYILRYYSILEEEQEELRERVSTECEKYNNYRSKESKQCYQHYGFRVLKCLYIKNSKKTVVLN